MESVIFGAAVLAVGYIVYWSLTNDNVKSIAQQRGLIRMRNTEDPDRKRTPKTR